SLPGLPLVTPSSTQSVPSTVGQTANVPHDGNQDKGKDEEHNSEEDIFKTEESSSILANITRSLHPCCEWKIEDTCIACLFQDYQKSCVQSLQEGTLQKPDIADAMATIGVFAPFLSTPRMKVIFRKKILDELIKPAALPELQIDDIAVAKAVRFRINKKSEEACETLRNLDRKMRLMFENILGSLPEKLTRLFQK
ncbi:hypothetical protein BGX27_001580, partial [Mortierella sp. AM989]